MPRRPEEWIPLRDLWIAFRKERKKAALCLLFFMGLGTWFSLTAPIHYLSEASFRDKGTSREGVDSSLLSWIGVSHPSAENEAKATLLSKKLMKEAIRELGLQASLSSRMSRGRRLVQTIRDNVRNVRSHLRHRQDRTFPDVPEIVRPVQVDFAGEEPLSFAIQFVDEMNYAVLSGKEKVAAGQLDQVCSLPHAQVAISRCGEGTLQGRRYDLTFFSLEKKAADFQRSIKIRSDKKKDPRLLELSFSYHDRHMAAGFLNALMNRYLSYLQEKQQRQMQHQLAYLEERRGKNREDLVRMMTDYGESLSAGVEQSGFTHTQEEIAFLTGCQQKYRDRIIANDLEILRLEQANKGIGTYYAPYSEGGDAFQINTLLNDIRHLRLQRDDLQWALDRECPSKGLLREFYGLTLDTAQNLLIELTRREQEMEGEARKYAFLRESLEDPAFEVTSLSSLLQDPVVQETVAETKKLLVAYQDESYRSTREQERLKLEMDLQRRFLTQHLAQTELLLGQEQELLQDKRSALRSKMIDLTNQQIILLENQLKGYLSSRMQELQEERLVLTHYLDRIQAAMRELPKKWVKEQILQEEMQSRENVVEELAKTVEMKNIALHLELIDSSPLDWAVPSLQPKPPRLFLSLFLCAVTGGIAFLGIFFLTMVQKGFPVTAGLLQERGCSVVGPWIRADTLELADPLSPSDLSLLRKVSSWILPKMKKTVFLIEGEGPSYARSLANLLHRKGLRVVLLDLSFDGSIFSSQEVQTEYGAYVRLCAGKGRFGVEELSREVLQDLGKGYDLVLAFSSSLPTSAEAEALAQIFDQAVVTVTEERLPSLSWYFQQSAEKFLFLLFERR